MTPTARATTDYPITRALGALLFSVAITAALAVRAADAAHYRVVAIVLAVIAAVVAVMIVGRLSRAIGQWQAEIASSRSAVAGATAELDGTNGAAAQSAKAADVIKRLLAERAAFREKQAFPTAATFDSMVNADAFETVVAEAQLLSQLLEATVESVLSIATASEQLSASSAEIAMCASEASRVSSDAVRLATEAMTHVEALGENGAETARITSLIQSLAERTRILSLNTTIEAGHAGASGRAMGVIATHIRTLAEDAAKGTQAITTTLDASAQDIAHVNTAISQVTDIATEIQHYQAAIATAVEEQSHVTGEIARAAHQAERHGAEVSRQLEQLATDLAIAGAQVKPRA
jgi:methyl-accepting chemotaxis protein